MLIRLATLSVFLVAISLSSQAQRDLFNQHQTGLAMGDGYTTVTGTVRTIDDKPLKDVRVELHDNNGMTVGSAYTNVSGGFEFSQVRAASYRIVASLGLAEAQDTVDATHSQETVRLRLPVTSKPNDGIGNNSVSVAQFKVPEAARTEYIKARDASAAQKPTEAQKHLVKALTIYPNYAEALTLRGLLKLDNRDLAGAVDDLDKAVQCDGNYALAYLVMGSVLNLESKFDDAIRALERGQTLAPNSWQAYFEMGKALMGKAQYPRALQQFDGALSIVADKYPSIHLYKANAMVEMNDLPGAASELQAYLVKDPKGPNVEEARRMLEQVRNKQEEAKAR